MTLTSNAIEARDKRIIRIANELKSDGHSGTLRDFALEVQKLMIERYHMKQMPVTIIMSILRAYEDNRK